MCAYIYMELVGVTNLGVMSFEINRKFLIN